MKNISTSEHGLLESIRIRFNDGERINFLHFWGHQPPRDGSISQSCFSQWYEAKFALDGIVYPTAEHYMMAEKALLFEDVETREKILTASNPGAAKAFGREVRGFQDDKWLSNRYEIVCRANRAKFGQNDTLGEFLLRTCSKVLVEASPTDRIWGIGLAATDPNANNPNNWKGLNLLGFALMEIRDELRK